MKQRKIAQQIWVIEDFFTPEECHQYITMSENIGYTPATVNTEKGIKRVEEVRNNSRLVYEDFPLAENL